MAHHPRIDAPPTTFDTLDGDLLRPLCAALKTETQTMTKDSKQTSSTRRGFLKGALLGTGATLLQACTIPQQPPVKTVPDDASRPAPEPSKASAPQTFDFSRSSPVMGGDQSVRSACQFCNANCGLEVRTQRGRVVSIEGLEGDEVQGGQLCVKADLMAQLVYNPRRLKKPLVRVKGPKGDVEKSVFKEVSWDEALEVIARKFLKLRDSGQAHTITNRTTGRMLRGSGDVIGRFFKLLGSPNATDVGPVCNDAGGNALAWTFGLGNFTNGYGVDGATGKDDLGSAGFYLFLGTNQAETHPVTFAYLLRGRAQSGAKLVVIDPRKTATAAWADRWLAPKPHTDLALALGMIHEIITKDLHDKAFVEANVLGFEALAAHVKDNKYTATWADRICGLPEGSVAALARDYAAAPTAAIFCNAGISHQLGAFDTYRALAFLAAITGNVGIPGAGCNFMHNTWPGGLGLPELKSKPPAVAQPSLPVGPDYFAQSILSGKPYRLRAVVTEGNPMLSSANSNKVREAFKKLEFYVYTGLFMEEPAYYADVILPVRSGLETEGVYMRRDDRSIRWQEAAVAPVGESLTDPQIWIELAHVMGRLDKKNPSSYWTAEFPKAWMDYKNLWAQFVAHTPGVGGMTWERMASMDEPLRWPCPTTDHPGVSTLYLDHPSWYKAAEALGGKKGQRFLTPSGKIEVFTPEMDAKLAAAGHSALPIFYTHPEVTGKNPSIVYKDELVPNPINPHALTQKVELGGRANGKVHNTFPLMGMIGRSSVVHFAGVTHWTQTGKQLDGVRLIQIHPSAASAAGINDGDEIFVESPRGKVRGTALVWQDMRPDTIFVPNGFGFAQMVGPDTGAPLYKMPANSLVDDQFYDNLSGQQAYKCFACRIMPV